MPGCARHGDPSLIAKAFGGERGAQAGQREAPTQGALGGAILLDDGERSASITSGYGARGVHDSYSPSFLFLRRFMKTRHVFLALLTFVAFLIGTAACKDNQTHSSGNEISLPAQAGYIVDPTDSTKVRIVPASTPNAKPLTHLRVTSPQSAALVHDAGAITFLMPWCCTGCTCGSDGCMCSHCEKC